MFKLKCAIIILAFSLFYSIQADEDIIFSSDFESGSIGLASKIIDVDNPNNNEWALTLRDDDYQLYCDHEINNDCLPKTWRTWFYVKAQRVPTDKITTLRITNRGWLYDYNPVYSYDQQTWYRFNDRNVRLDGDCKDSDYPEKCQLVVEHQFTDETVWIARFYPYTYTNLNHYLDSIKQNPHVSINKIGNTEFYHQPIYLLQLTDTNSMHNTKDKKHIWIHARTHPAETGSSFLLEGLINFLLSDNTSAEQLLNEYIFHIVPMHNIDGIKPGNYRTAPRNIGVANFEDMWHFDPKHDSHKLSDDAVYENRLLNKQMQALLNKNIILALNLHSSNSEPDTAAFFFTHFADNDHYTESERNLYRKQIAFIKAVAKYYDGRIEQPRSDGGNGFYENCINPEPDTMPACYPESWWWHNKRDTVNAITLETTYGKAGFDHWVTQDDMRDLGQAIAEAILAYGQHSDNLAPLLQLEPFASPYKPTLYERFNLKFLYDFHNNK